MSSRIIVKNLPKHATEERVKDFFASCGEITDCRLQKTKEGVFRNFGFIGFRRDAEAKEAIAKLNRSFFDTSRIHVEAAHAPGSDGLARPWSKYAPGTTAHKKAFGDLDEPSTAGALGGKETGKAVGGPALAAGTKAEKAAAAAAKLKKAAELAKAPEELEAPTDAQRAAANKLAFDEGLDDLAYLKTKTKAETGPAAAEAGDAPASEGKGKKTKKKKKGTKAAAAEGEEGEGGEAAGGSSGVAAEASAEQTGAGDEEADASGRLYVTNLAYGTTEEELRSHFEAVGEVGTVQVCKDEDTLKSRGFGYVTYVFPENAVQAQAELDLRPFQGRMLRVKPAREKPEPKLLDPDKASLRGRTSSYKRKLLEKKKKIDAHLEHTWNLLYVSANAAADAASAQLGVEKGELFGKDSENAALTAALTETSIIQQTKRWLQKEGIRVEAFEQAGTSLAKSKAVDVEGNKRRDDTFIVKHLPAGASAQELRERFARYGDLVRCSLAPSCTVAIVQYTDKTHAKHAFQKVAFSRYRHVPLYLEWAPGDVFSDEAAAAAGGATGGDETAGGAVSSSATAEGREGGAKAGEAEEPDDDKPRGCLFVKNLSFSTVDGALKSAFSGCKGFRSAIIMKKKAAIGKGTKSTQAGGQSMGYGFVEFDSPASAQEALRRRQGVVVDGHALQLQVSQRGARQSGQAKEGKGKKKAKGALQTQRLCVRNLAFEATRKELAQLFGAYGSVAAVRLPKKADYSGHRGFAFVDFASKAEAAAAYEALQHTHLYGRRMVIEPAEESATDVASVQETAAKKRAAKEQTSEAKKRRRAGVLNAPGEAGAFEDAMM